VRGSQSSSGYGLFSCPTSGGKISQGILPDIVATAKPFAPQNALENFLPKDYRNHFIEKNVYNNIQ